MFTEADDFWVIFPTVQHATLAALEGQYYLTAYNTLQQHPDFQIRLSGFGIDAGRNVYVSRRDGKLFGRTVDRAFHLGEDLAENCTILVTDYVRQQLLQSNKTPYFSLFHRLNPSTTSPSASSLAPGYIEFSPFVSEATTDSDIGPLWMMKGRLPHPPTTPLQPPPPPLGINQLLSPNPESNPGVKLFLQRHLIMLSNRYDLNTKMIQLQQLDNEIRLQFMKHMTALMYGCDWVSVSKVSGIEHTLFLRHTTHSLLAPIVRENNGQILEENLFLFASPLDAFRAMLHMHRAVAQHNKSITHPTKAIPLKGIAVHCGEIVIVPDSNVHWGTQSHTFFFISIHTSLLYSLSQQLSLAFCVFFFTFSFSMFR